MIWTLWDSYFINFSHTTNNFKHLSWKIIAQCPKNRLLLYANYLGVKTAKWLVFVRFIFHTVYCVYRIYLFKLYNYHTHSVGSVGHKLFGECHAGRWGRWGRQNLLSTFICVALRKRGRAMPAFPLSLFRLSTERGREAARKEEWRGKTRSGRIPLQ